MPTSEVIHPANAINRKALTGGFYGIIAKDVLDFEDKAVVIIPEFHRHLRFGPCRWQARNLTDLPIKGDRCLVVFDNRQNPWIVAWWPFDEYP